MTQPTDACVILNHRLASTAAELRLRPLFSAARRWYATCLRLKAWLKKSWTDFRQD